MHNPVRDGVVKDYAEIARLTGLSRARVTQIVNLTLLAPAIQEEILVQDANPSEPLIENHLRESIPEWIERCCALAQPFVTAKS